MDRHTRKLITLEAQEPIARRADGMWSIWLAAIKRMPAEQKQAELDVLSQQWADMMAKEPPYTPAPADWDALFCMLRPLADWWHRADQERFEVWQAALHVRQEVEAAKKWAVEIAEVEAAIATVEAGGMAPQHLLKPEPQPKRPLTAFDIHCNEYGEFRKLHPVPPALVAFGKWKSPPSYLAISRDLWNAR